MSTTTQTPAIWYAARLGAERVSVQPVHVVDFTGTTVTYIQADGRRRTSPREARASVYCPTLQDAAAIAEGEVWRRIHEARGQLDDALNSAIELRAALADMAVPA